MDHKPKSSAKIIGTGSYVPERVLTNEEIEKTVPGANAEWTFNKLGISERRIARDNESSADLALLAARRAIADAGIQPSDIDLIVVGTTTPRRIAPSTACFVQHHLGAFECPAFDLAAVCSSFIYSMSIGLQFIVSGTYQHVLVIGVDTFSKITDWSRRDCVFFGDGAGAAVLTSCPVGVGILSIDLGADGSEDWAWTVLAGGSELPTSLETLKKDLHFWQMDGKAVYRMATHRIPLTINRSLEKANLTVADVAHVVPHQPGIGVLREAAEIMGIPFEKFHTNMDRYANTSAATVGITLDEANKSGNLKPGDIVVFAAVGAGWTWGSMIMRWL